VILLTTDIANKLYLHRKDGTEERLTLRNLLACLVSHKDTVTVLRDLFGEAHTEAISESVATRLTTGEMLRHLKDIKTHLGTAYKRDLACRKVIRGKQEQTSRGNYRQ
jgi:hypothetical protein